jgi:hypothetical protein
MALEAGQFGRIHHASENKPFKQKWINKYTACINIKIPCRDSAVGIASGYGLDDREVGVRVPVGSRISSSSRRPTLSRDQSSPLSNGYLEIFLWG